MVWTWFQLLFIWSVNLVACLCLTVCDHMDCSTPGLPVHHHLLELAQTHVHLTISSSVIPFSPCLQSFPASGSFPVSQLFASGGQSIGASEEPRPRNRLPWAVPPLTHALQLLVQRPSLLVEDWKSSTLIAHNRRGLHLIPPSPGLAQHQQGQMLARGTRAH